MTKKIKILTGPSVSCYQGKCLESFFMSWDNITQEVAIPEVTDRIFFKLSSYFYRCSTYFTISHTRKVNRFYIVLPLFKPAASFKAYRLIFNHPGFSLWFIFTCLEELYINWDRAIFKPVSFLLHNKKDAGTKTIRRLLNDSGILKFFGDESSEKI